MNLTLILSLFFAVCGVAYGVAMFLSLRKWNKEDLQWEAYNKAYDEWEKNGEIGEAPKYEDFI